MKKRVLIFSVLISLMLLGGVVWAVQQNRTVALRWDDPDWDRGYFMVEFPEPMTVTLSFSGTVRLVDENGAVMDSQPVHAPGCEWLEEPGGGQCGAAYSWGWETDNYPRKTITEEIKLMWVATDHPELVLAWVPSDCDLAGAGCTVEFDQAAWALSMPQSCRDALAACGTWQDADGWWFVSSFEGTKPWTRCLPGIAVGGPQ